MSRDRDPTAAEYALRLLTGDELRDADKRLESDPAFAREVARWRGRLAPLHQEVEGVSPPAPLWDRIAVGIGTAPPANDNLAQLRRRVRVWRVVAGTMTAKSATQHAHAIMRRTSAILRLATVRTITTPA